MITVKREKGLFKKKLYTNLFEQILMGMSE